MVRLPRRSLGFSALLRTSSVSPAGSRSRDTSESTALAFTNGRLVVTDDKEGAGSVFQKNIGDAEILVTTPFHPAYLTADIMDKAKNLKLCVTAGVGSE